MSAHVPAISDYGLIGDTRSAALVSREGAVDFLCWPRFDSPAVFLALLDRRRGGACGLQTADGHALAAAGRRYVPETNVLETTLVTPDGARLAVTDAMPMRERPRAEVGRGEEGSSGASGRLVRRLVCTDGEAHVRAVVRPAFNYGRAGTLLTREGGERAAVFRSADGPEQAMVLHGSGPLELDARHGEATLTLRLRAGESGFLVLTQGLPGRTPALDTSAAVEEALEETLAFWRGWSARGTYEGPHRDAVRRSLLVLKALTYAPTGGIVAAPTFGLPEAPGGARNYDYRFCWLRDAGFTVRAFLTGGYVAEAAAYLRFLDRNIRDQLRDGKKPGIFYGIAEPDEPLAPGETALDHLAGFGGARPVNVGNAARDQTQNDIFGETLSALGAFVETTGELPPLADDAKGSTGRLAALVRGLAGAILRCWREPDQGIWEVRGEPQHFFHSKALCWVGLDRAAALAERLGLADEAARWRQEGAVIRADYLERGWNARRGAYTQAYGSDELDAAVVRPVLFGALEADDPRVRATLAVLVRELGGGPDGELLWRYRPGSDGLPGGEGTFTSCGLWVADCHAMAGRTREGSEQFARLLARGNDLGLFSEEIDAESGAVLGNFPQGFTHMGIVNGAERLRKAAERFGQR